MEANLFDGAVVFDDVEGIDSAVEMEVEDVFDMKINEMLVESDDVADTDDASVSTKQNQPAGDGSSVILPNAEDTSSSMLLQEDSGRHSPIDPLLALESRKEPIEEENDESRVDLEYVENHMRHAGSNAGPVYESSTPMTIGRDMFARFDHQKHRGLVSRAHALIESRRNATTGELEYILKDTSVNGTFLGANRLTPGGPGAKLEHGDVIGILTSHSSPIETYSPYGEFFTVTLGLRWLRPNVKIETIAAAATSEHHTPILSRLHSSYAPGTFVDEFSSSSEESETEFDNRSFRSLQPRSSPRSGINTPKRTANTFKKSAATSPRARRTSKILNRRKSLTSASRVKSRSGNDTDDTDGDDEREYETNNAATTSTARTPGARNVRKPLVDVSRPSFNDEGDLHDQPRKSNRSRNASASNKTKNDSKTPKMRTASERITIRTKLSPLESHASSSTSAMTPSYRRSARRAKNRYEVEPSSKTPSRASTPSNSTNSVVTPYYWDVSGSDAGRTRRNTPFRNSNADLASEDVVTPSKRIPASNSHWMTPRSSEKKRNRPVGETESADELSKDEPARKLRSQF